MLHPHRLRVAFEDLKAAIVAAAAHAFAAAEGLCGAQERPTDWRKNMSLCRKPRVVPVFSGVAVFLWFLGYSTYAGAAETSSSRIPRLATGCCAETFQSTAGQLCNGKSVAGVGGTLSRGAAVELRLYNRPRSQPVRSTHLGVRKYRQLVVTSRAHV
jgi:hypothetical protein